MWLEMIFQNSSGALIFGKIDETLAILLFAVFLIAVTIGIRWVLNKYDNKTNSEAKNKEVLR